MPGSGTKLHITPNIAGFKNTGRKLVNVKNVEKSRSLTVEESGVQSGQTKTDFTIEKTVVPGESFANPVIERMIVLESKSIPIRGRKRVICQKANYENQCQTNRKL